MAWNTYWRDFFRLPRFHNATNLPRAFLDQKEQDQANLKKRSQPIGLRSRYGRESENATVIDLMKRLSLETVVSRSRVSRTQIPCLGSGGLWCYIEMREISLIGAP